MSCLSNWKVGRWVRHIFFLSLVVTSAASSALDVSRFVLVVPGNQWSWTSNGVTETETVGSAVVLPSGVSAVPVSTVKSNESGTSVEYQTLDQYGFRVHQGFDSNVVISGKATTSTVTFSPPAVYAPLTVDLGGVYASSGTASVTYANVGTYPLDYSTRSTVVGTETVTSLDGTRTWNAIKVMLSMTVSGTIGGQFVTSTSSSTGWLVDGLGVVQKQKPNKSGIVETWKLSYTNIPYPTTSTTTTTTALPTTTTVATTTTTTAKPEAKIGIIENARWAPLPVYPVMDIVAQVTSAYEVTSVSASIAGKTVALNYSPSAWQCSMSTMCAGWKAQVDLGSVPRGTYTVVVTARDAMSGTVTATRTVIIDPTPILNVSKPTPYSVATPAIDIEAGCSDDVAGCSLSVRDMNGTELLSGAGAVSGTINLSKYLGQTTSLTITATDSGGQKAIRTMNIPVVDATRLELKASVPGKVFDVTADRVLYLDDKAEPQTLKIRNLATGIETSIYSVSGDKPVKGYLYSGGAIFMENHGTSLNARVYDWRNGTLVDIAPASQWLWVNTNDFVVRGQYAMYSGRRINDSTGNYEYYLRNLAMGTDQLIGVGVGNNTNSLTAQGTVAYWKSSSSNYEIFLWKNGTSTQVTSNGGTLWNVYPVTDGTNIVFKQTSPCCNNQTRKILFWDGSATTVLADMGTSDANPPGNYSAANGYVAFSKPGTSGQMQIWRRSPSEALEQLTFFSTSSQIDTIADTGAVTLINAGKLYVHEVGGTLVELVSGLERRFWLNGDLYGVVAGSIFKINRSVTVSPTTTSTTTTSTSQTTTTTASTTTTTQSENSARSSPSSLVIALEQGWNLLGNSLDQMISVASIFGEASSITTVWKWDATTAGWQFYSPTLAPDALETYAKSKGYGVLASLLPGDGFWVNAKTRSNLGTISGKPFSLGASNVISGWNLVATSDRLSPAAFNLSLADPLSPPPATGVVPINLTTLWAWDNTLTKWYFYAPGLEAEGGTKLYDYAIGKGYLDFTYSGRTLDPGMGFWVNKP